MNTVEIKCAICPIKCKITVLMDEYGNIRRTSGYGCTRGKNYAEDNAANPRAVFKGEIVIFTEGKSQYLPVETTRPIPTEAFSYAEDILRKITLSLPIKKGENIVIDFIERGVNLIALEDAE